MVDKVLNLGLPLLAGAVAFNLVLLLSVMLAALRDPYSTGGLVFARVLHNPAFWAVGVAAFGSSFYLAR